MAGYPFGRLNHVSYIYAFLVAQKVKNLCAVWETWVWSLVWEDLLEERAWQPTPIFLGGVCPWTEEPGGPQSMGSELDTTEWLSTAQHIHIHMCLCVYICAYTCMCVCVYIYVYTHTYVSVCICVYTYTCVSVCIYVCIHMHVCLCVYICVYTYTCVSVYMCVYTYTCVSVCIYVFTYTCVSVCIYMYIHIHVSVYICVYTYTYVCLCVYICIYIYMCVRVYVYVYTYVSVYICVYIYIHAPHFLDPFICQWTFQLLLCVSYCENFSKKKCYRNVIIQEYIWDWLCSLIMLLKFTQVSTYISILLFYLLSINSHSLLTYSWLKNICF